MMACSTLKSGCREKNMGHPGIMTDIFTFIDGEVKRKIISTFGIYRPQDGEPDLVQFWAAKEIGNNVHVLTTTHQPSRLFGNNKELQEYYQACLDRKHYVFRDATREAAFGLAGRVFLYCTPAQTQDVHKYHTTDHCPQCQNAISAKMGSFAVPVIVANKCVGVLEFVMGTPRDYNNDILVVQRVLEHVGLQTSIQSYSIKRTYIDPEDRSRETYTSPITHYCCLDPLFGLSSADARKALEKVIGRRIPESTFALMRKNVGFPQWPYIRKTTVRASSAPETQISETVSEANSFIGAQFADNSISYSCSEGVTELPREQTMTSDSEAWLPEISRPDSMENFGGMESQDINAPLMYPDSMDDENPVNIDHPDADMISVGDYGFSEQTMTSDVEPCIESGYVCQDFMPDTHGMKYECYNAPVPEDLNEGSIISDEIYMGTTLLSLISNM